MYRFIAGCALFPLIVVGTSRSDYHLQQFYVDEHTISITGFSFSSSAGNNYVVPEWVNYIFGSEAVFNRKSRLAVVEKEVSVLSEDVVGRAKARFNLITQTKARKLPPLPDASSIHCSIELLSYVRVFSGEPFDGRDLPVVGTAKLIQPVQGESGDVVVTLEWECWYRGIYENWRAFDFKNSFWPAMIFCPQLEQRHCDQFERMHKERSLVQHELHLQLSRPGIFHHAKFSTVHDPHRGDWLFASGSTAAATTTTAQQQLPVMAVCTAWPYLTPDAEKVLANQAMVYEFVRYYANMGVKVFAYDAFGGMLNTMLDSDYVKANPQREPYTSAIKNNLVSYNYTLMHKFLPNWTHYEYDSNMKVLGIQGDKNNMHILDNDKTMTLTQCRFEARAIYGIERVLVSDFDEFLYCGFSEDGHDFLDVHNPAGQRRAIDSFFDKFGKNYSQLNFQMLRKGNRSKFPFVRECIIDEVRRVSSALAKDSSFTTHLVESGPQKLKIANGSILSCFDSDHKGAAKDYGGKSAQINYRCPFTNYHHACGMFNANGMSYDCVCDSYTAPGNTCKILHLSTKEFSPEVARNPDVNMNEIWFINNAVQ